MSEVDLVEINEAFAPQLRSRARRRSTSTWAASNTCGGAIALGHPLGASGSRITAHLVHRLAKGDANLAVGAACIGGGQGIALVLKAPPAVLAAGQIVLNFIVQHQNAN